VTGKLSQKTHQQSEAGGLLGGEEVGQGAGRSCQSSLFSAWNLLEKHFIAKENERGVCVWGVVKLRRRGDLGGGSPGKGSMARKW